MAVKVGFIGSGGIANAHMRSLAKVRDAKMVAFCDIDAARAQAAAETYGGKAYTVHKEMLAKEELDAVYVCVPPHAHGCELDVVAKGLALFVEKPVANSLARAKEICAAIEKAGVVNSVGYHWRYNGATDKAAKLLKGKTIGMVLGYWMGGMPGVAWWRVLKESGGQFVEQTTHIVDLARCLVGDVERVSAAFATRALSDVPNFTVSDVGTVMLEFESGAIGTISNTCLLKGFGHTVGLHIFCPDIVIEESGGVLKVHKAGKVDEVPGKVNANLAENKAFIKAIKTGDTAGIRSPYADALKTLAVTLAANESARTGRKVRVKA